VIKLFCKNASIKGFTLPNDYKSKEFYKPTNKTYDIYLKEEEVEKIYNAKFKTDYLDNARDWLIIGIRTGLRISDFLRLDKSAINDGFIELSTKKTQYAVAIPLHHEVEAILQKRNGEFPRALSDAKFNKYIKEVGEIAGLTEIVEGSKMVEIPNPTKGSRSKIYRKQFSKYPKFELISSHTCRRTFATLLFGKIDTLTIMKIIGHTTEKQLLDYIKITPKESAIKLQNYWKQIQITES
jgi:integrase